MLVSSNPVRYVLFRATTIESFNLVLHFLLKRKYKYGIPFYKVVV